MTIPSDTPYPRIGLLFLLSAFGLFIGGYAFYATNHLAPFSSLGALGYVIGIDFVNFWAGPHVASANVESLFSINDYNSALHGLGIFPKERVLWSYPSHLLLFMSAFAQLPFSTSFVLWNALGVGCYLRMVCCGLKRHHAWGILLALLSPATIATFWSGQNAFFTAALSLGALMILEKRPRLAGVFLGILTVKPQLGLVWPLVLLRKKRWLTIGVAMLVGALLIGTTALVYGMGVWEGFFRFTLPFQSYLIDLPPEHRAYQLGMPTLPMALQCFGFSHGVAFAAQLALDLLLAIILWQSLPHSRSLTDSALLISTAALLSFPYVLPHDYTAVSAAIIWYFLNASRVKLREYVGYGLCYLVPMMVSYLYFYFPVAPFITLGACVITALRINQSKNDAISTS